MVAINQSIKYLFSLCEQDAVLWLSENTVDCFKGATTFIETVNCDVSGTTRLH